MRVAPENVNAELERKKESSQDMKWRQSWAKVKPSFKKTGAEIKSRNSKGTIMIVI